jgi:hypothetical protein
MRVHTELGQFGPAGVEAALTLNAQSDPRARRFYQGLAVLAAMIRRRQDLMASVFRNSMVTSELMHAGLGWNVRRTLAEDVTDS